MPNIDDVPNVVGYNTFDPDSIGFVELNGERLKNLFVPNRTLFVDIIIKRSQLPEVFKIKPVNED